MTKRTMLALSLSVIAAVTTASGAGAYPSSMASTNTDKTLTPITYYGKSRDYREAYDPSDRYSWNHWKKMRYRWHRHHYRHGGEYWDTGWGYCYYHPYSWYCKRH